MVNKEYVDIRTVGVAMAAVKAEQERLALEVAEEERHLHEAAGGTKNPDFQRTPIVNKDNTSLRIFPENNDAQIFDRKETTPATQEEALQHAHEMAAQLAEHLFNCVDDGATLEQSRNGLNRPGAILGLVLALLPHRQQLGLTVEQCFIMTMEYVRSIHPDATLEWHTDDHHHDADAPACAGCGHMMKALQNAERYGVSLDDMAELFALLDDEVEGQRCTVLNRDHFARGAFVIGDTEVHTGEEAQYTINPWNGEESGSQYFSYGVAADSRLIQGLVGHINQQLDGSELDLDDYNLTVTRQNDWTFALLAEGLPLFQARFVELTSDSIRAMGRDAYAQVLMDVEAGKARIKHIQVTLPDGKRQGREVAIYVNQIGTIPSPEEVEEKYAQTE